MERQPSNEVSTPSFYQAVVAVPWTLSEPQALPCGQSNPDSLAELVRTPGVTQGNAPGPRPLPAPRSGDPSGTPTRIRMCTRVLGPRARTPASDDGRLGPQAGDRRHVAKEPSSDLHHFCHQPPDPTVPGPPPPAALMLTSLHNHPGCSYTCHLHVPGGPSLGGQGRPRELPDDVVSPSLAVAIFAVAQQPSSQLS